MSLRSSEARGTLRINFLAAASLAQPSCERILRAASTQKHSSANRSPLPGLGPRPPPSPLWCPGWSCFCTSCWALLEGLEQQPEPQGSQGGGRCAELSQLCPPSSQHWWHGQEPNCSHFLLGADPPYAVPRPDSGVWGRELITSRAPTKTALVPQEPQADGEDTALSSRLTQKECGPPEVK